jgi:peptide/nickel transport system permease protein
MLKFLARRLGIIALTMVCLSLVVFFFVNLEPNLKKLAIFNTQQRASAEDLENWLTRNGYRDNFFVRYGRWVGVVQQQPVIDPATGANVPRFRFCDEPAEPAYNGILQGNFGCSTAFKTKVENRLPQGLKATGLLMFWVMMTMVPVALLIGVLAGMREGSRLDRGLSVLSITSTATPEYVSGIIFSVIFATWLGLLNGSAATATSEGISFYNFSLPVMTLAVYGVGYIARMTRASMAEVMSSQYIRTARLKGLNFGQVVLKHALRNALIAPFTVIMLQFPWLLTGVVVVEAIFRYQGFGFLLVSAASNNDIDLLLACGLVSVAVVLVTQLISDIGYAWLNPRIRMG